MFTADPNWTTIKTFAPTNEDGQPAEVQWCRMPARFYRVVVQATEGKPGWSMTTGSGNRCYTLALDLAAAVAGGMIGLDSVEG